MNKKHLLELIEQFSIKSQINQNLKIDTLTTNMEGASKGCAVFYKIYNNEKSKSSFSTRVSCSNPELIITTCYVDILEKYNYIIVEENDFLEVQKLLCDNLYPFDSSSLKIVGVTGTNGKTTVANLCVDISLQYKKKAFSIGTIGIFDSEKEIYPTPNATTPSYVELRKILNTFQDDYDVLFFEVSSHALEQKRLLDLELDAAAWTSFSQDHLDYHKTLEDYFLAKAKIADKSNCLYIPQSETELASMLKKSNIDYKIAKSLNERGITKTSPAFEASYNKSNLELALMLNEYLWGEKETDVLKLSPPKGRFTTIEFKMGYVIVDYAHTPDALDNVCHAIKEAFPKFTLSVVFGCGGDRDKTKRPLMAEAVGKYADEIIVTSDNPRTENPEKIIDDIVPGLKNLKYQRVEDRKDAIEMAISNCNKNSVVLIAGKGHEEYQEINGKKHDFSDIKTSQQYIKTEGLDV